VFQIAVHLHCSGSPLCARARGFWRSELVARGLRVEELTAEELTVAQDIRGTHPRLSLPDTFAFSLASVRGWTLLTGDGELRALAQSQKVAFFGVLWVLDQLFDGQIASGESLAVALEAILAHPRCRLPRAEAQTRIARYRKSIG
jgi:hypothetical protein